jgi:hypothetical protein
MVGAHEKVAQRSNNWGMNKRALELDESKYRLSGLVDCTNTFCWQQLAYNYKRQHDSSAAAMIMCTK